ncbi:MAG: hypothetical protein IPO09_09850 [Anaeromyxobacter sp.]|nr:hypothetical protein [Anaeromyxobacter sp.]MBL0278585.1 hypothetical protein [Anaeromyxobacter sp.]
MASRDKWKRVEAIGRLKAFLVGYREAWRTFRAGAREVAFPEGTYGMRQWCEAACASST